MGKFKTFFENEDLKWVLFSILSVVLCFATVFGVGHMIITGANVLLVALWALIFGGFTYLLSKYALIWWTKERKIRK